MNRMVLWIVNVALLLLAGVVTAWVLGQVPSLSVGEAKGDAKSARADRKAEHKGGAGETDEAVVPQGLASVEDADTLWQQTLFRPERTEDITQPAAEEVAAGAVAVDLELVGLARIGERFVAVIVSYRGQPRRAAPGAPGLAPTARRGDEIDQTGARRLAPRLVEVAVAEQLEAAADREHRDAVRDRRAQRGDLRDQGVGDQGLIAILPAADQDDIRGGRVEVLTEPQRRDLHGQTAPAGPLREHAHVAAIAVDGEQLGVDGDDAEHQRASSQNGAVRPRADSTPWALSMAV